ncbi:MAG: hypothetical protein K6T74_15305 [Geminicoccaceae bacterium]|nr:hypothetical protein [Geminicoccaceae bacterium]
MAEMVTRFGGGLELFSVAHGASAFHDPCQGPLDDPSASDDDEPLRAGRVLHDLRRERGLVPIPPHEVACVAAVGVDLEHG